jgi:hypothetical protein
MTAMTPGDRGDPMSDAEWTREQYDEKVAEIAGRLRRLADEVEREAKARPSILSAPDDRPDYINAAGRVINSAAWGFANLNLDSLVSRAATVHQWRDRQGQS